MIKCCAKEFYFLRNFTLIASKQSSFLLSISCIESGWDNVVQKIIYFVKNFTLIASQQSSFLFSLSCSHATYLPISLPLVCTLSTLTLPFLSSHKPFPLTSTCTKLKQKKDILPFISFKMFHFISFHDISLFLSFWVETNSRRFLFSKIDSSSTSDLLCWLFLLLMLLLTNSLSTT